MKTNTVKIIDGKRYNIETSTLIAKWGNGYGMSDFHYVHEDLYRTQKGAWFLVGEGGALSSYAESYGRSTCGGSNWSVLSDDEAFEWLEKRKETEALEQYFSGKIEEA